MISFNLGSDVYLEFKVKVNKGVALISGVSGELYRGGEYLFPFAARHSGNTVSCVIIGKSFTTIGDYEAKFKVGLDTMGMREHAVPFKMTESVLGKKRQMRE